MSKTQVKSNDRFSKFRMESPLGKLFYNFAVCDYDDHCLDRAASSTSYHCGILL